MTLWAKLTRTDKKQCPPVIWHILEVIVNGLMVIEVSTRWVAYGKVSSRRARRLSVERQESDDGGLGESPYGSSELLVSSLPFLSPSTSLIPTRPFPQPSFPLSSHHPAYLHSGPSLHPITPCPILPSPTQAPHPNVPTPTHPYSSAPSPL